MLIRLIHDAPCKFVLAVTGGGAGALAQLLEEPGGSRVLLEAVVPYSSAALEDWLGGRPEHFCSPRTARAMAMAAWMRAGKLEADAEGTAAAANRRHRDPAYYVADTVPVPSTPPDDSAAGRAQLLGVACTASLASDRPKRGPHRIHIAWQTEAETVCQSLELVKGPRDRRGEEQLNAAMILNAIAEACGVSQRMPIALLDGEQALTERCTAPDEWRRLLSAQLQKVSNTDDETASGESTASRRRAIFPGSFNPLHQAHLRMAELATELLGLPVEYEISILNVDKPPLDYLEMRTRLLQFAPGQRVWFTRAPTFERKAELFPGATFIVGADTIRRIGEPKYYGGDERAMLASIDRLHAEQTRFLVFGRSIGGQFQSLHDLSLPPPLAALCQEVPEGAFRVDISSTQLRAESH